MRKRFDGLLLVIYPIITLVGLPFINNSFTDQIQKGMKFFSLMEFYCILAFFIVSILLFRDMLLNLKKQEPILILIGLVISLFFVVCSIFPQMFFIFPAFIRAYFYNYLVSLYMSLTMFSVYLVLFLLIKTA